MAPIGTFFSFLQFNFFCCSPCFHFCHFGMNNVHTFCLLTDSFHVTHLFIVIVLFSSNFLLLILFDFSNLYTTRLHMTFPVYLPVWKLNYILVSSLTWTIFSWIIKKRRWNFCFALFLLAALFNKIISRRFICWSG